MIATLNHYRTMTRIGNHLSYTSTSRFSRVYHEIIKASMLSIRINFWAWINSFSSPPDRGKVRLETKNAICKACKDYG
jgi:hypothetical protein